MCNLYSIMSNQAAMRALGEVMADITGNLPPMPGVFPDYAAPIVRNTPDGRELALARWGMRDLSRLARRIGGRQGSRRNHAASQVMSSDALMRTAYIARGCGKG